VEVFAFGRMPLAFSARCFTARHHRLNKDECEFKCMDDDDGLLVRSTEGQDFLVFNGIQTQSAGLQCLLASGSWWRQLGVSALRLSPCAEVFGEVLRIHDALRRDSLGADEALVQMRALALPGPLVQGYALGQEGLKPLAHPLSTELEAAC
jgi:O2-independent ubiquinone biosynthesis protein UbiV